jgi:hypothetical protein
MRYFRVPRRCTWSASSLNSTVFGRWCAPKPSRVAVPAVDTLQIGSIPGIVGLCSIYRGTAFPCAWNCTSGGSFAIRSPATAGSSPSDFLTSSRPTPTGPIVWIPGSRSWASPWVVRPEFGFCGNSGPRAVRIRCYVISARSRACRQIPILPLASMNLGSDGTHASAPLLSTWIPTRWWIFCLRWPLNPW